MPLPDVSRLTLLPPSRTRELSARLRALGVDRQAIAPFARHGEDWLDRMRRPLRTFYLRRVRSPLVYALRLFVFMDPVTHEEAIEALASEALLSALLEVGLIAPRDGGMVCPFLLNLVEDQYLFCDELSIHREIVMGVGATTAALLRATWPVKPLSSVLDLGCGAGTAALMLAEGAGRVVGSDINPRAIVLAKLNQALSDRHNVTFIAGDLFAPIGDQRFDLIVAQPPFVAKPDSEEAVTFLHGGARGDELMLRILSELLAHLAPGGRAVFLADLPRYDDVAPAERIRAALGEGTFDLLLLASPPKELGEYVAYYAANRYPDLGEEYGRAVHAHLDHLTRVGVTELCPMLFVVRAAELVTERSPWTHTVTTKGFPVAKPTGAQIERLFAAQDLLTGDSAAFLAARLVVPEGTRFTRDEAGQVDIALDASRLIGTLTCGQSGADLLTVVHESPSVADAVATLAKQMKLSDAAGHAEILRGVRIALSRGLLELALDVRAPA
ncbi:MAG TPA: methyltransferase [Polyangiaceae bacterium]|nr:methyltransferase [Polyangiaceae bacterium]